jgi:hypothetical protein
MTRRAASKGGFYAGTVNNGAFRRVVSCYHGAGRPVAFVLGLRRQVRKSDG